MKKLLCAVLSGIMAFSTFAVAVPITASAAESQESVSATYGDFEYTLEDDYTCTITGYNGSAANVTIPSTIYGYKVSALSDTAFLSNKNIRSVIIPNGVLRIGALCFDSCTNLQEITIPDSVMHIVRSGDAGSGGFLQFCDSLKEITLGSGLENFFDTYDLNGSHSFECIDISKNNKYYCSIDGVAFSKDKKKLLKYPPAKKDEIYTIPDTVSKLSMPMGFTLNENLKAVIIPKSVKEISLYTFGTSLNSIYGYKGTVAETYAKENGFKFIALDVSDPTSVSLNKTSLTLDVSKSYTLAKTVSPSNAVTSYTWSSSNTRVATVDGNGKVTAKKAYVLTLRAVPAVLSASKGRARFVRLSNPDTLIYYASWLFLLLALVVLPATRGRIAWLAVLGSGLVAVCRETPAPAYIRKFYRRRKFLFATIASAVLVLVVVSLVGLYRYKKDSAGGRWLIWNVSAQLIRENPAFGVGTGCFAGAYGNAQEASFVSGAMTEDQARVAGAPDYAFNDFLQITVRSLAVSVGGRFVFPGIGAPAGRVAVRLDEPDDRFVGFLSAESAPLLYFACVFYRGGSGRWSFGKTISGGRLRRAAFGRVRVVVLRRIRSGKAIPSFAGLEAVAGGLSVAGLPVRCGGVRRTVSGTLRRAPFPVRIRACAE